MLYLKNEHRSLFKRRLCLIFKKSAKTEKRRLDKKENIYNVSMDLFLTKGYYNTSIRDIVSKLDVSIGTFYNHFANKEELFIKIYDKFASMIFSAHKKATESYIEDPFLYIVRGITTTLLMYKKYKREALMLRVKEVGSNKLFEEMIAQFTESSYLNIKNLLESFVTKNKIKIKDSEKTAICYVSSINGIILFMLKNDVEEKISNLAIPLIVYNLNAIGINYDENKIETEIEKLLREFN